MEEVLVSGALRAPDEGGLVSTASANQRGDDTHRIGQRTSLEALLNVPLSAYVPLSNDRCAISTAIPDSIDGQSLRGPAEPEEPEELRESEESEEPGPSSAVADAKPYARATRSLRKHLPHLNNVLKWSRRKQVKVECYDYSNSALASCIKFGDDLSTDENVSLYQVLKSHPPEDIQLRLIVAEDLSTALIECLGSSLGISPEAFEEHLLNGGWRNGKYDDPKSDTWITHDMVKNYTTIRWYRPVKRKLQRPYSASDWENILAPEKWSMAWTEAVPNDAGKPYGVRHRMEPLTNIIRRDWSLKTNAEAHVAVGDLAAWEERVTIWSRQRGSQSIVVLLLDPLPILQDRMSGAGEALQKLAVSTHIEPTLPSQNQDGTADSDHPAQPILQKRMSGTKKPTQRLAVPAHTDQTPPSQDQMAPVDGDHPAQESLKPLTEAQIRSPTSIKPREQSGSRSSNLQAWLAAKLRSWIPLFDSTMVGEDADQSGDPETGQGTKRRGMREGIDCNSRSRRGMAKFLARLTGDTRKKPEGVDGAKEPDTPVEPVVSKWIRLKPVARCMFEGIIPRGPVVDYDSIMSTLNIELIAKHMDKDRSTAESLALWIQHNDREHNGPSHGGPLGSLFAIAQRDTLNVLHLMELALKEIGEHILDDTLIQQRVIHWRHLLERFDTELLQLEDSLRQFAKFIETLKLPNTNDGANPGTAHLLEDCITKMSTVGRRTNKSYTSLMANMSIVESKRGIAEAESVTKLTELAFFFIPLTFSASVFSMQVKELNASTVSLSAFFIVAIIITTCSYGLRLFIRSASVIRFRRRYMAKIRADAGLPPGASIPTTSFLIWVWYRIGFLTAVIALILALLVVPLAFLWTRDMNHGYQAVITILELIIISGFAYVVAKSSSYTRGWGLRFR